MLNRDDLKGIPKSPGCYLWKDEKGEVIYVGKSKNLHNRMKQYFIKNNYGRLKLLVSKIFDFDYEVVPSEVDALLLETNLINKYNPKYNLKIKNSKVFQYAELIYKPFFQLKIARKIRKSNSKFFGPFPDGHGAIQIIKLFNDFFPLSNCKAPNSGKSCINHEIGKCLGYCVKKVVAEDYKEYESIIINFFKGRINPFKKIVEDKIVELSKIKQFEDAGKLNDKLGFLEKYKESQSTIFQNSKNIDIINYYVKDQIISISISYVRFGNLVAVKNFTSRFYDLNPLNSFHNFLNNYYGFNLIPDEIILKKYSQKIFGENVEGKIKIPQRGKFISILKSTHDDAKLKLLQNYKGLEAKFSKWENSFFELSKLLNINLISSIEMTDISNMGREAIVGGVVNFDIQGKNTDKYRKYIIKSLEENKQNDYKSIEEISYRHFRKSLMEKSIPTIFIIDGKYQINNAIKVRDSLKIDTKIIALKKDKNHTTDSLILEDLTEIKLDSKSNLYMFFNIIQYEVHRFTINFMKEYRSKKIFKTSLHDIKGLTDNDINLLFKKFKTLRQIKIAKEKDIEKVIGKRKTNILISST